MTAQNGPTSVLGMTEITTTLTLSGTPTKLVSYEWTLPVGAGRTTLYASTVTPAANGQTGTSPPPSTSTLAKVAPQPQLSTGAIAGIAIGTAVFVTLLALGILFLFRRRKPLRTRSRGFEKRDKFGAVAPYYSDANGKPLAGSNIETSTTLDYHSSAPPTPLMPARSHYTGGDRDSWKSGHRVVGN